MTKVKKILSKYNYLPLIIILALLLRLPLLSGSFWLDESAQALEVTRPLNQQFNIIADFQPPLLHLILHFASMISHTEAWLRLVGALVPSLVTIFFSYKLAQKLFNQQIATISSLLLTTSSFHVFYSQELRPYSLPAMFAVLSSYYLLKLINNFHHQTLTTKRINHKLFFHPLTAINLLGLYSSYLFPFFIIAELVVTLIKDMKNKQNFSVTLELLKTQVLTVLLFLPWLPTFFRQLQAGKLVQQQLPGWSQVVSIPQLKAVPLVLAKFTFGVLNIKLNFFFIIFTFLTILPLLYLYLAKIKNYFSYFHSTKKSLTKSQNQSFIFISTIFIVPLLTSWLISFIVPIVRPKRLLFLLPSFYIIIAYLFSYYQKNKKKYVTTIMLASFFLINFISLFSYYTNPKLQRENWRELYQKINSQFSPTNTIIIYSFPEKFAPITWYEQQSNTFPSLSTKTLHIDQVTDLNELLKPATQFENILIFDYLRDLTDPEKKLEKTLKIYGFQEVGVLDQTNIGFVRILTKANNIIGMR